MVYGTPTMFTDLITVTRKRLPNDPSIYKKLSSLELALTSGAYCTPELFKEMKKVFNFKRIQVVLIFLVHPFFFFLTRRSELNPGLRQSESKSADTWFARADRGGMWLTCYRIKI